MREPIPEGEGTHWGRWRRLLPAHARERLFDPAVADLEADRVRRGCGPPPRGRVTLLALECLRLSLPRVFVRNRRPTPTAWGLLATVLVFTAIVAIRGALVTHYAAMLSE